MMIAGIEIPMQVLYMSWPLGDTGVGKMGEMPPGASQAPRRKAAGMMARGHSRVRKPALTAPSICTPQNLRFCGDPSIGDGKRHPQCESPPLIESRIERGRIQAAPIRRHLQPIPRRRLPALRAAHAEVSGPVPQRRLQALALELRRLGSLQGVARG